MIAQLVGIRTHYFLLPNKIIEKLLLKHFLEILNRNSKVT